MLSGHRTVRDSWRSALAVLASLLVTSSAHAQAAPPAHHEDSSFDFMNVLADRGMHDIHDETWNLYGQFTLLGSYKPPFSARYTNAGGSINSLVPSGEGSYTGTLTLFGGVRLWKGAEAYIAPEIIAERPLSDLRGLGGAIQNFELQKTGSETPQIYRSRTYLRQKINLGGSRVEKSSQPLQLGGVVDSHRLVFTAGNFSILDVFDRNSVSWDPRQTFLNMAFMTHASWDFPSDARGYSWGATAELYWDDWAFRIGRITPPQHPNQLQTDFRLYKFYGDEIEVEHDHHIARQAGAVRLVGYRNRVDSGRFDDAIAAFHADPTKNATTCPGFSYVSNNASAPDLCWARKPNIKVGIGISVEQHILEDVGVFFRAMYSDGNTEVEAFNAADRSLSLGAVAKGGTWNRPLDVVGLGFGTSWISKEHASYLALGGVDGFIGDGNLRQGAESVIEMFYSYNLARAVWISADYQHIVNPGYNQDRGPVNIVGARVHAEF